MLSFAGRNAADTALYIYPCSMNFVKQLMNTLFDNVRLNAFHILSSLLPPESAASQNYSLRPRVHNLQLPDYASHFVDSNFIERMLLKTSTSDSLTPSVPKNLYTLLTFITMYVMCIGL